MNDGYFKKSKKVRKTYIQDRQGTLPLYENRLRSQVEAQELLPIQV